MKHTEKEMLERTKKVLSDLHGVYFKEENIIKIVYHENDEVARPSGEIMNTWTGVLNEPLFNASEFLIISDETGEPLYYQNANMIVYEIKKDDNGNYY